MKPRRVSVGFLVLALLVWGVYGGSLDSPFQFDDWHVIPQNPEVRGPSDIPEFFVDVSKFSILTGNRDYRPLFLTSMALCWWVGGGSTVPFHVVSLMLHLGNVLLLFFIVRLSFATDGAAGCAPGASRAEGPALLAAALFAVQPAASEAVLYISSQSVPMAAFFYLLAFLLFLTVYSGRTPPGPLGKWSSLTGSYLAYALALLSKPIAVTLPLVLLSWQWILGSRSEGESWRRRLAWSRLRRHLPYAAVTLAYLVVRSVVAGNPVSRVSVVRKSLFELLLHFLTQTEALVFYYLKLALVPVGQNADIEFPRVASVLDPRAILALLMVGLTAWLLFRLRRHRQLLFWSLWFPTCLLVTTYLIPLGQTVREARMYLSLAGLCVVVALLVRGVWTRLPLEVWDSRIGARSGRGALATVVAGLLVVFALAANARSAVWSSKLTLWADAARKGGTWRAHMNYGLALDEANRSEEALLEFRKAVEQGPYAWSHMNLGLAYVRRGENDQGLVHLRTAARLWPTSPEVWYHLGQGLAASGNLEAAEAAYQKAIELRDNYLRARQSLADLYWTQGKKDLALAQYRRLVQLEASNPVYRRAVQVLEQDPSKPASSSLFARGWQAQKAGRREEAIASYEKLLAVAPEHRQGTFNLAWAYLAGETASDWKRSVELFQRVLEIDPDYTEALHHLGTANWMLGRDGEAARYDRLYLERGSHEGLKAKSRSRLAGI